MPVLSNNGRLISSLPVTSTVSGQDELLLQSSGITKRINYATLSSSILNTSINALVNFKNPNNKFTGSFYNPNNYSSNFYTVNVRNSLSVSNGITGNLTGNVTGNITSTTGTSTFSTIDVNGGNIDGTIIGTTVAAAITGTTITATTGFSGNITGNVTGNVTGNITSPGTSTFTTIDVNGGTIDGATIGATSATTITGTTITANTGFSGNITSITGTSTFSTIDVNGGNIDNTIIGAAVAAAITGTTITATTGFSGNVTGDVYNSTATKVLESGTTTPTFNNGVSTAYFYGTSSYAIQALTSAYAAYAASSVSANGVPVGGSQYQLLTKNSGTNYDAIWTNPITASNQGVLNHIAVWDSDPRTLKNLNNFYYNGGAWNSSVPLNVSGRLNSDGITVGPHNGGITSSYVGYTQNKTIESPSNLYQVLSGHKNSSIRLALSASGYCTMSLMKGQTTTVLVKNQNNFTVSKWSGSLDGGTTANTKVYWSANGPGTAPTYTPTITSGNNKKDLITFVNVDDKIFGTIVQNFL